jgi:hypothetical protein
MANQQSRLRGALGKIEAMFAGVRSIPTPIVPHTITAIPKATSKTFFNLFEDSMWSDSVRRCQRQTPCLHALSSDYYDS